MPTPNKLFEPIIHEKNLHEAWIKVKNYAKSQDLYQNDCEFDIFQQNLEANIAALKYEIEHGCYKVSSFQEINIPRPDGRIRKIVFAKPKDRIVIQAVVNVIGDLFETDFSKNSYGNRLNLDANEHKYIFKRWQDQYIEYSTNAYNFLEYPSEFYYLKADIQSFYDNIDNQRLLSIISEKINDPRVISLIQQFLNVRTAESGKAIVGLPQGPAYSHFFANIYLNNLDKLLENETVHFVRYVDDLLILFESKDDAIRAKWVIESYLKNLNLKFNKDKTTELLPITNSEPLIDDIKDIKYDLNLACNRELPKKLKDEIGAIFYEIFFETPEFEDINELSKHISYILPRLKKLETEENLINIIYDVLVAEPLKPHATKIVIVSLTALTSGDLDQRFIDLFGKVPPHLKLLFIQSLSSSEDLSTQIIELIKKFSTDHDSLVKSAAVMKLAELKIELDIGSIREMYSDVENSFVKKHYLYYLTKFESVDIPDILHYLRIQDEALKEEMYDIALWSLAICKNDDFTWTALSEFDFEQINCHSLPNLTYVCFCSCRRLLIQKYFDFVRKFDVSYILSVLEICFTNLRREFLLSNNISKLISLATIYEYSDGAAFFSFLRKKSIYILGDIRYVDVDDKIIQDEIDHRIEDVLASEPQKHFIHKSDGLYFHEHKIGGRFHDFTLQGLQYYCVFNSKTNQSCVLEIIEEELVKSSTLATDFSEWETFISETSSKNLTTLIESGEIDIEKTHCFYSIYAIPEGYELISTFLQNQDQLSEEIAIKILIGITSRASECGKTGNFILHSINGYSLVIDHNLKIKFINLGLNLTTPVYFPIFSDRRKLFTEPTAGFEFLEFLAFEMLTKNCPITEIDNIKKDPEKRYLSESNLIKNTSLHLRQHIFKKLGNVNLEYRYESFGDAFRDLKYLSNFNNVVSDFNDKSLSNEIEFFDFLTFHLENIGKKEFFIEKQKPLDSKIERILTEVFNGFVSFQRERNDEIIEIENKYKTIKTLIPERKTYRWLQPTSKQLVNFTIGYENQHKNLKQISNRHFTIAPATLSLILALKLELRAFIRCFLFNLETKQQSIRERMIIIENIIIPNLKETSEKILVSFACDGASDALELSMIASHETVEELQQNFKSLSNKTFEVIHRPFQDFKLFIAFLFLFCSEISLSFRNNTESVELSPIFGDKKLSKKSKEIKTLIKNLSQIADMMDDYNVREKSGNVTYEDVKIIFTEVIRVLHSLTAGERKTKSLVSEFYRIPKKGEVQVKRLIGGAEYEFDRNQILIGFGGDFLKLKDIVAVDLIKDGDNYPVVNVCPASQNLKRLEKEKQRTFGVADFLLGIQDIYKNRFLYPNILLIIIIWAVICIVVSLAIYKTIGFSEAIMAGIAVLIIGSLLSFPFNYIKSYLLREHN
jgi:retron-type reverse transcriptase